MQHVWFGQDVKLMQMICSDFCNVSFIKLPEAQYVHQHFALVRSIHLVKSCFFLALVNSALFCLLHPSPELSIQGNKTEADGIALLKQSALGRARALWRKL